MNRIALGTVQFGLNYGINNTAGKPSYQEVINILIAASQAGIDTLDTASGYGESEKVIGQALTEKNLSFKIISKFPADWQDEPDNVIKSSLSKLRSGTLYGYMFHDVRIFFENPFLWDRFLKWKNEGLTAKIGFSLYHPEDLEKIWDMGIEPDIVQIPYNLFDRRFKRLFSPLQKAGTIVHARSAFLQGLLLMEPSHLPDFFLPVKEKLVELNHVSQEIGVSVTALCLGYVLREKQLERIVIGCDSSEQLGQNLQSVSNALTIQSDFSGLDGLEVKDQNMILPYLWPSK